MVIGRTDRNNGSAVGNFLKERCCGTDEGILGKRDDEDNWKRCQCSKNGNSVLREDHNNLISAFHRYQNVN
jgi:hypothetical protein